MQPEQDSASVILVRPKFEANVAAALRAAAAFGAGELIIVAQRYTPASGSKRSRQLRPLRMKSYAHVTVRYLPAMPTLPAAVTPVAVEVLPSAETLPFFPHPASACYIFGPEDGTLDSDVLRLCHRFVSIPSEVCLNLGAAVYVTLYARRAYSLLR